MWCATRNAAAEAVPLPARDVALAVHEEDSARAQLAQTKHALERAHFDEAARLAGELLQLPTLSARLHNAALELLAIAQIAARKERDAQKTLDTLYRRDPEYTRQVSDPGPAVDAAFARAQQGKSLRPEVPMRYMLDRDPELRMRLAVDLSAERDAVESVHVYVDEGHGTPLWHLVGPVERDQPLSFVLPAPGARTQALRFHAEAHAPSGAVLGRLGEPNAPLTLTVPTLPKIEKVCPPQRKPLRREWWLWTTLGLVVSGFVVATAVTAN
jgi:hypothetical protein